LLYWGYIMTFTKVLTIYLSWIYPSIILPYPPSADSWNSFNRSHFSIFVYEYIIVPLYSVSFTLSLYLPPSYWYQPPDRTCFVFLFSVFEKKKEKHFCLRSSSELWCCLCF
jgi:hypothetical protein